MRERVHRSHCSGQTSSHVGRLFTQTQGMLHRAKYSRFRNDSLTSLDEGTANASLRVKNASSALCPPSSSTSTTTSNTNNSPSQGCPGEELPSESEDLSSTISTPTTTTTTFCTFIPKMASLKLSNPVSLLGLKSFSLGARDVPKMRLTNTFSSQSISAPSAVDLTSACLSASSPPKQETGKGAPSTRMLKPEVEEHHPGGEDWNLSHNVEPLGKALKGWSLPRDHIQGSGITYTVRYMGCVEVMQSMRSLDFNTRTQVTREAISRVCEAVPGAKGAMRKRKPPSKGLSTVLGKSNLQFAGMNITLNISTSSLNLMIPDSKQIIANHHMQSISFASGGDPDTTDYVAYVAKDPVNQRACHILECSDSIAQDVINTIGQAFELRFKQYMKNPSAFNAHNDRIQGFSGLVWNEQNEELEDLEYSNEFPGKQPPSGGSPATRIKEDSAVYKNSSQLQRDEGFKQAACESIYENCSDQHKQTLIMAGSSWNRFPQSNANTLPIKATSRSDLFDDPCYMNTQNVEKADFTGKNVAVVQGPGNTYREHSEAAPNNAMIDCHTTAPPPTSPSSMKEQLVKEVWYHGRMTRQEAERLLLNDGDFLVRESMTTTGQYVLTGLQGGQAKHLLLVDPEGMVRTKDHIFDSVNHLISYHVDNHLPIISPGHELFLKKTVRSKQQQ